MRILKYGLAVWLIFAALVAANAQSPTVTSPYGTTTTNNSSTITTGVGGAFQQVWAASTSTRGRVGCTIQNTGTNPMYVYFGPIASATIAKAVKITAGQPVSCNVGGVVLKDQVSISGTTTETFYAAQQ